MTAPFVTTWREYERAMPLRLRVRAPLRAAALRVARLRRSEAPRGIAIVHYHYVFDDQQDGFARQLAELARSFEPVKLSEAVTRLEAGTVQGNELVVTFDDGFRNQLRGARVLAEHGISGCFYLISDLIGADRELTRRICADRIEMPVAADSLTWDEAAELVTLGHEIGSHTRTHPNLAAIGEQERRAELVGSRQELESRLGVEVRHVSAPFGTSDRFGPAVSASAQATGFASCASAQRGINTSAADVFALRRHHLLAHWPLADVRTLLGFR